MSLKIDPEINKTVDALRAEQYRPMTRKRLEGIKYANQHDYVDTHSVYDLVKEVEALWQEVWGLAVAHQREEER